MPTTTNETNGTGRAATFTSRTIGVEVEFVGTTRAVVSRALAAVGIVANDEGYNHRVPTAGAWKLVTDGSVRDSRNGSFGGELVSPVLSGLDGLRTLRLVLRTIAAAGATVNATCGLHVHVGASDLSGVEAARLVLEWEAAEDLGVRGALAPSRRDPAFDGACYYAKRTDPMTIAIAKAVLAGTRTASSVADLTAPDRYRGLNVHAFGRYGTVEFRSHQGSVDADKVAAWVVLAVRLVEAAKDGGIRRSGRRASRGSAEGRFLNLLVRVGLRAYARDGYAVVDPILSWAGAYLNARRAHFAGEAVPAVRRSIARLLGDAETVAIAA